MVDAPAGFEDFADPPSEFRQMPFWSLNSLLTKERVTEMLSQFAERGMGGVFCHARPGLITEYLSDEWWAVWSHMLSECERLGLECHIYDEDSFPSVFAGGHTMANCPNVGAARLECHESGSPGAGKGELVATVQPEGAGASYALVRRREEPRARTAGYPYIDILDPDATKEFLRNTHAEYAKRYADRFGGTIRYVFTDEPDMRGGTGFHFTRPLIEGFLRDHGYDIRERLLDLGFSTDRSCEVRFDYWSTANRLFVESFARPVYEWCAAHDLRFTGHYWDHEWPSPARQPSNMALIRWMQAPGIDLLGFQFDHRDPDRSAECLVYVKEASSVGNQLGSGRVLCEAYGARGYDMALCDFKPISDYLLTHGVNLNSPHLSHMSVAGMRKYEWPQTLSDHATWWDDYALVADHDARLACATCKGHTRNRVLLLHPTTSAWLHHVPESFDVCDATRRDLEWMARLRDSQRSLMHLLEDNQLDYDLGDEFIIAELGSAADGKLGVGECAYDVVVLPEMMENVTSATRERLAAYLAAGGTLLALGEPPKRVDGRLSDALARLKEEHAGRWIACASRDEALDRLRAIAPPYIAAVDGTAMGPQVSVLRRDLGDGRVLLAIANPFEREVDARVRVEGNGLYALDTMRGEIAPVATVADGDRQLVDLRLGRSGHALWLCVPDPVDVAPPAEAAEPRTVELRLTAVERVAANVLPLDYCDVAVAGETRKGVSVLEADTLVWRKHGFDENAWLGIQYKRTFVDRAFPPDSGFELTYRFRIEPEAYPDVAASLELAVERPWLYEVEVNDHPVDVAAGERYFDEHMRKASIAPQVAAGTNRITLRARPFDILCEVMPVRVLGEFALEPAGTGFALTSPRELDLGDWRAQGMPFYADAVRYAYSFALDDEAPRLTVSLGEWAGSVVRASLDGTKQGAVAWPPYAIQLDGPFRAGEHRLALDVVGNMKNLMGPHFDDGLPGIWTWRNCPGTAPEGGRYRFYPSGMMAGPTLTLR